MPEEKVNTDISSGQAGPKRTLKNTSEPPLFVALTVGLGITGISVLAVFRGATLGYFFLFSGAIAFAAGLFFRAEKKKP